jgi:ribonuclease VapC
MAKTPTYILDTFALIAYLQDESAASRIQQVLEDAEKEKCHVFVSVINLGEMLYITERRGGVAKVQDVLALVRRLPIEILPVNEETVLAAAHIKANYTVSYADAFAIVAAQGFGGSVLTGDPEFGEVEEIVRVEWLES